MSIDIKDCKWAAKNLDHCHSARETALVLFPGLVDELIEARKKQPAFDRDIQVLQERLSKIETALRSI